MLVETFVRDGAPYAATTLAEFRIVDGAGRQVQRLRDLGLACVVFTNQPEVARGTISPATLEQMHDLLRHEVPLDAIYVCPHDDAAGCDCRKPKPGLLQAAARDLDLDLAASFVIGDRWRDVDAGHAAGCRAILIEREYSACTNAGVSVGGLEHAVDAVLRLVSETEPGVGQPLA